MLEKTSHLMSKAKQESSQSNQSVTDIV